MEYTAEILLTIGGVLLLGLATDMLGKRTFLPRVTLMLILGILLGKDVFDLIPQVVINKFELIADMTLLMIAFLLGGRLTRSRIRSSGRYMLWISICEVIVTCITVSLGLALAGMPLGVAVVMGSVGIATAPAATYDIVHESNAKSSFAGLLLSIVTIDDVWALIIFSFGMAGTAVFMNGGSAIGPVLLAVREVGGAVMLGILIGLPAAYLTGRLRKGQPMLTEALGLVFLCGGAAMWLHVSFLIASMVMGSVIVNLAKHHDYPFHEIENIEWPFMVVFFVLAGASLELSALKMLGFLAAAYFICRIMGKLAGAWLGARISGADRATRKWMGAALMPQAGVAIGMALVASSRLPEYRQTILSIVISTTVLFEILGPVFTKMALKKAAR